MGEATKFDIPQQGSQKSRKRSGLEKDPGTKATDFKNIGIKTVQTIIKS